MTGIPETIFKQIKNTTLQPCSRALKGPCQNSLKIIGQFQGTLTYQTKTVQQDIFVLKDLHQALIGLPAIEALALVTRINSIRETTDQIIARYPQLFQGLGSLSGEYVIRINEDDKPYAISIPRRVAIPLLPKVKEELNRMEQAGVISRVDVPTKWCTGMVVVPKTDGAICICVDLTKLNSSVQRERHPIPSVDHILAQLGEAAIFSKLDANSGFWQIHLNQDSALLTTFISPFGRFCFNRLPFGITSAPKYFQKCMSEILSGLDGTVCMMDDVLVYGRCQEEHDRRLTAVLERLQQAKVTLNKDKCKFSVKSVRFLGHIVDNSGIHPDPQKLEAIQMLPKPKSASEVRRFLGMANQLGKFLPSLAEISKPLCDLLSKNDMWNWGELQEKAFQAVKKALSSSPVLAIYKPDSETAISADASSFGIGGVLSQKQPNSLWKPISFASRALTTTEQRYAQIEKEALAVTWSCERFSDYLLGKTFHINTDHKPLVPLLSTKSLEELPVRIQRFKMRLMRYSFTISHVPGKSLVTADTLSRAPISKSPPCNDELCNEVEAYVDLLCRNLPASDTRITEIKQLQEKDQVCQQLTSYCRDGWPGKARTPCSIKPYVSVSGEITVLDGLLMRGSRIIIPSRLRPTILEKLHTGHQGISKCREKARSSVWWPGLGKQLETLINNCSICNKFQSQAVEPLIPSALPSLPWQKVATDLFKWKGATYLLVVDYFSKYIEISKLEGESSQAVILRLKSIFARHGIPQQVISDNGPQYSSIEFSKFAKAYQFVHTTSSPKFPQSNGEAERAVCTIKNLLKKAGDPYAALLEYRSTPVTCSYSPAELLMNRKLRSSVPISPAQLQPSIPDYSQLREADERKLKQQKENFDVRHRTRELTPLRTGDTVWVTDHQTEGTVVQPFGPRSYQVEIPSGTICRNRRYLNPLRDSTSLESEADSTSLESEETNSGINMPEVHSQPNTEPNTYKKWMDFSETCSSH